MLTCIPVWVDAQTRKYISWAPASLLIDVFQGVPSITRPHEDTTKVLQTGTSYRGCKLEITAVEPVPAMVAKFKTEVPGVSINQGAANALPCADASADAVFVAQAFHWFATTDTLKEFHRALRPHGVLGLIWNAPDRRVPWVAAYRDVMQAARKRWMEEDGLAVPQYITGDWRGSLEEAAQPHFTDIQSAWFDNQVVHTHESLWQEQLSRSFIAALGDQDKQHIKDEIFAALDGAVARGEKFAVPLRTEVVTARVRVH